MNRIGVMLCSILLVSLLAGCIVPAPVSHETFVTFNDYWIGKDIRGLRKSSGLSLGISELSNGNKEEGWLTSWGKCRVFFEFDSVTSIIVRWRFEGTKTECVRVAP